ncbi:MAG: hypothetical protein QGF03_05640 [SAR324 cluster bacterium]|jgi:hypothetical protein|nr:hypothetical protein [SAR324 cluster bacterium]
MFYHKPSRNTSLPSATRIRGRADFLLLPVALLLLSSCYPKSVDYEFGWTTETVIGAVVDQKGNPPDTDTFIVVKEYYGQFVELNGGSLLYTPKARLVRPDANGYFRIIFDLKASRLELAFVASGFEMQRFRFNRQFGVGELHYDATLEATPAWREHFMLQVGPFLENFIIEQRYQMPNLQQLYLGDWLATERLKLHPNSDS